MRWDKKYMHLTKIQHCMQSFKLNWIKYAYIIATTKAQISGSVGHYNRQVWIEESSFSEYYVWISATQT